MAIQIPLDGGLNTQADPEEFGASACTVLTDLEFDKPGLIYKRAGRGASVTVAANIEHITLWVAPDGYKYWIITDTVGKIYWSNTTVWPSLTLLYTPSSTTTRIHNYGSMLRFSPGIANPPQVYQYINRDFYWGGHNPAPAFDFDAAKPVNIPYEIVAAGKWTPMSTNVVSGMAHTSTVYEYKTTFVYDGNQETPLPSSVTAISNTTGIGGSGAVSANDDVFYFDTMIQLADWNSRITGINIYRSTAGGPYRKIVSASTLGRTRDANIISLDDGLIGNYFGDSSSGLTSAINSKELYINGFAHTINSSGYLDTAFALLDDAIDSNIGNTFNTLTGHTEVITATASTYNQSWRPSL